MSDRNVVSHFGADTRSFDEGINRMTSELRNYQKALRENKKEQKDAGAEIKAAEKELAAIEKAIKKTGVETQAQKDRQAELNEIIRQGKQRLDDLKIAQAGLQKEIESSKKKIEEQKKAIEDFNEASASAKDNAKKLATQVGGLAAAGTAAIATLLAYGRQASQWADDLNTLSKVTGISTQELQKMQYAAKLTDVSVETLTGSMTKLTRSMSSAAKNEAGTAAKAFDTLGVSVRNVLTGELRDRQEVFGEVIDALKDVGNETKRDSLAMEIFGKSAQELNPLIKGGADTLKTLGDQAERAGLILSQEDLDKLNEFNDKIDLLSAKGSQIQKITAGQVTPAVDGLLDVADELLDDIKEMADSGELEDMARSLGTQIKQGARDLKELVTWVAKHKEAVAGAAGAMVGWKVGLSVGTLVNNLVYALKAAKVATDAETGSQIALNTAMNSNPIGVVIGLVGALAANIGVLRTVTGKAADETSELNNVHSNYLKTLKDAQESAEKQVNQTEADISTLLSLKSVYDELCGELELTSGEKKELENVSKELAEVLGISSEQLQDESGNYKDLTKSADEYIEKLREQVQFETNKEKLTAAYQSYDDASIAYNRAKAELDSFLKENEALKAERDKLKDSSIYDSVFEDYDNKLSELEAAVGEYRFQVVQAADAIGEYEEKIGSSTNAFERSGELIKNVIEGTQKVNTETGSSSQTLTKDIEELADSILDGSGSLEEFYRELKNTDGALENAEYNLTSANKALEDNKGEIKDLRDEAEKTRKELQKAKKENNAEDIEKYAKAYNEVKVRISELKTEQMGLKKAVADAEAEYEKAAWSAKPLAEKLSEIGKESASLRSELSSLSGTYQSLSDGQELSLDTLLQLAEKYPEYAAQLLSAAGNADKQREAVKALYEAKRSELILTLEKAKQEIAADNDYTDTALKNAKKRLAAIESEAAAGAIWANSNLSYIRSLREEIDKLSKTRDTINAYDDAIKRLKNTDINSYKPSGSSSGSGSSGSGSSGSSPGSVTWTTKGGGEVGTGSTRASARMAWAERMSAMGKMSDSQLSAYYRRILSEESVTADESYSIRLKLKNLSDKLEDEQVRKKEEAEKKKQEAEKKTAEERKKQQELALAAYEALVKGEIDSLNLASSNIQAAADRRVAAIDSLLQSRQRKKEDAQRKTELAALDRELKYYRGDELAKESLERRRQEILNEQNELEYQRMLENQKVKIQQEANGKIEKNTAAIDRLNTSLDGFAYVVAKAAGNLSNSQIVNHNTRNQNIRVIQNSGLTQKQMEQFIKSIYSG